MRNLTERERRILARATLENYVAISIMRRGITDVNHWIGGRVS